MTVWCISPGGDLSISMPFPALRFRHHRARTMRQVGREAPPGSRVLAGGGSNRQQLRIEASRGGQTITAERIGTPTERIESVAEFFRFIRKNGRHVSGATWLDDPELPARDMLHISGASAVDQIGQSSIRINALD